MNPAFDFAGRISERDQCIAAQFIGSLYRPPDLVIAPAGHGEYLFRWWITPHSDLANVYFHVQTESDPERPLHDHPWDSTSVILSGGYTELINPEPGNQKCPTSRVDRKVGDVIHRPATWGHRLILPTHIPYSMSLFSTGPKIKQWGFWMEETWVPYDKVTHVENGHSYWKESMKP